VLAEHLIRQRLLGLRRPGLATLRGVDLGESDLHLSLVNQKADRVSVCHADDRTPERFGELRL
jgi:hypothetical protein